MFNKKSLYHKEKKNLFFILFRVFFWIVIIIGIPFFYLNGKYIDFKEKNIVYESKIIEIEEGDTFLSLSKKLGINKMFLKYYLKNNKPDYELKVGSYKLKENSTIEDIIIILKVPIANEKNITILEGWNIYDIDNILTLDGYIKKGEYIEYVTNEEKIQKLSDFFSFLTGGDVYKLMSLEGFLYPDTYKINPLDFKINNFVINQLETFESKIYEKILKPINLTNDQILDLVNLSSIVEKEEKNVKNKPIIAGILKKRLNEGWMLGADITVCYPYELIAEECKMNISKYIYERNDYNTRTMLGLPKTPIGNPSLETIKATLYDEDSLYYYYLHDTKTGQIYYGKTNEDHEQNKSLYLR